jgi:hypothetical protein
MLIYINSTKHSSHSRFTVEEKRIYHGDNDDPQGDAYKETEEQ